MNESGTIPYYAATVREPQDPEVRRNIEISRKEYLAGKSRPAEELLAELKAEEERERSVKKRGGSTRRQKDPYNRTRQYPIKKPTNVLLGEGEYRLRLRRFRFRYDIEGREVMLHTIALNGSFFNTHEPATGSERKKATSAVA